MNHIYFIGGSPCSGKSTVAEYISKKYDMYYFKVDDFLEQYTEIGYAKNYPICKKQYELSPDAVWLRNPEVQCKEEFIFYDEIRVNSAVCPHLPGIEKRNLKVSLERLFQPNDRVQPAPDLFPIPAALYPAPVHFSVKQRRNQLGPIILGCTYSKIRILRILHPGRVREVCKVKFQMN